MKKKLIFVEQVQDDQASQAGLLNRREAILRLVGGAGAFVLAGSGLGALLTGCGGAETGGTSSVETSDAVACTSGTTVSVGTDKVSPHTHKINLTIDQITAQTEIEITLLAESRGGTDLAHTHWVTVTAAQLTQLVNGEVVTIYQPAENSDEDEHDHMFEIFCV